ncbi:MAG: hypothetical protein Q9207_006976 [Kuettlingeria erythrocarpa]
MDLTDFQDPSSVQSLLEVLRELGIRRLDLGARYPPLNLGRAEELLGETREVSREFTIDTKVYTDTKSNGAGDLTNAAIAKSAKASLQRLKALDGVNVLHAHRADPSTPLKEQIEGFNQQIELGRCQDWGLSNVPPEMLDRILHTCEDMGLRKPSCYQGDYNFITRGMETKLLPILRAHNIAFNAFRPLAAGFLTGKLVNNAHQDTRFGDRNPLGKAAQSLSGAEDLHNATRQFDDQAKSYGLSPNEIAIRWVAHHSELGHADGIIVGASNAEQIRQTVGMIKKGPLPREALAIADSLGMQSRSCEVSPLSSLLTPAFPTFQYVGEDFSYQALRLSRSKGQPKDHGRTAITAIVRAGFQRTLEQNVELVGHMSRDDEKGTGAAGKLKLTYPSGEGVADRLVINDLAAKPDIWHSTYQDLRRLGMPVAALDPDLLLPSERRGYPFRAQANLIPGGCLLGVCLHHSLFDGLGGAMVVGAWARNCRELQRDMGATMVHSDPGQERDFSPRCLAHGDVGTLRPRDIPPVLQQHGGDNALLEKDLVKVVEDPLPWQLLGLQQPSFAPPASQRPTPSETMISAIFVASTDTIHRLQKQSTPEDTGESSDHEDRPAISKFEAIAALVWVCVLRARYPDLVLRDDTRSRLRIPTNVRQVLGIAHDYPGNVLMNSVTELPVKSLVADPDRPQVSSQIHASLNTSRDVRNVRDAVKLSLALPELALRRPVFPDTTSEDVVLTSWQDLPFYGFEWGSVFGPAGRMEYVRIPRGCLRGICALLPRQSPEMVEMLVSLSREQSERLQNDPVFAEYFRIKAL